MAKKITFHTEDCNYKLTEKTRIKEWLTQAIIDEEFTLGEVSVVLCSDAYLLEINNKYLNHNYFTDIITFDYTEDRVVSGDLFISVDTVRDNAAEFSVPERQEMLRVIVHGVLHLCGQGDKTKPEAEQMRNKENLYLARY